MKKCSLGTWTVLKGPNPTSWSRLCSTMAPLAGFLAVTDQDAILQIDGGGARVLEISQAVRARLAPGSRSRAFLEQELKDTGDALRVSDLQQLPSAHGHRRMTQTVSASNLPFVSTTVGLSSHESQLLSYFSQPEMRGSNVSVLFMIVGMCGQPPAISKPVSGETTANDVK